MAKASTAMCHHRHKRIHIRFLRVSLLPEVLLTNVANVNDPLLVLSTLVDITQIGAISISVTSSKVSNTSRTS